MEDESTLKQIGDGTLPSFHSASLSIALAIQRVTAGTKDSFSLGIFGTSDMLRTVEPAILDLYEAPVRVESKTGNSDIQITSHTRDPSDTDAVILRCRGTFPESKMTELTDSFSDLALADASDSENTPLIVLAEPKSGIWESHDLVQTQVSVTESVLIRLHTGFTVRQREDKDHARQVAQDLLSQSDQPVSDETLSVLEQSSSRGRPELPPEQCRMIDEFYSKMSERERENSRVFLGPRTVNLLGRLSRGIAQIQGRDEVSPADANTAIRLTKESMRQVGLDPETGVFDSDMVETGQSTRQRNRESDLKEIVYTLSTNSETGLASLQKIKTMAEGQGYDHGKVEKTLTKLGRSGEIVEPKNDQYRTP